MDGHSASLSAAAAVAAVAAGRTDSGAGGATDDDGGGDARLRADTDADADGDTEDDAEDADALLPGGGDGGDVEALTAGSASSSAPAGSAATAAAAATSARRRQRQRNGSSACAVQCCGRVWSVRRRTGVLVLAVAVALVAGVVVGTHLAPRLGGGPPLPSDEPRPPLTHKDEPRGGGGGGGGGGDQPRPPPPPQDGGDADSGKPPQQPPDQQQPMPPLPPLLPVASSTGPGAGSSPSPPPPPLPDAIPAGPKASACETAATKCRHSGTCVDLDGGYTCACTERFMGAHCERLSVSPCSASRCKNGGTCQELQDPDTYGLWYHCDCTPDWTGPQCGKPTLTTAGAADTAQADPNAPLSRLMYAPDTLPCTGAAPPPAPAPPAPAPTSAANTSAAAAPGGATTPAPAPVETTAIASASTPPPPSPAVVVTPDSCAFTAKCAAADAAPPIRHRVRGNWTGATFSRRAQCTCADAALQWRTRDGTESTMAVVPPPKADVCTFGAPGACPIAANDIGRAAVALLPAESTSPFLRAQPLSGGAQHFNTPNWVYPLAPYALDPATCKPAACCFVDYSIVNNLKRDFSGRTIYLMGTSICQGIFNQIVDWMGVSERTLNAGQKAFRCEGARDSRSCVFHSGDEQHPLRVKFLWWGWLSYEPIRALGHDYWEDCVHYGSQSTTACLKWWFAGDPALPHTAVSPTVNDVVMLQGGLLYLFMLKNGKLTDDQVNRELPMWCRNFIREMNANFPGTILWFEPPALTGMEGMRARLSGVLLPIIERETDWVITYSAPQYTADAFRNGGNYQDIAHHRGYLTAAHATVILNALRVHLKPIRTRFAARFARPTPADAAAAAAAAPVCTADAQCQYGSACGATAGPWGREAGRCTCDIAAQKWTLIPDPADTTGLTYAAAEGGIPTTAGLNGAPLVASPDGATATSVCGALGAPASCPLSARDLSRAAVALLPASPSRTSRWAYAHAPVLLDPATCHAAPCCLVDYSDPYALARDFGGRTLYVMGNSVLRGVFFQLAVFMGVGGTAGSSGSRAAQKKQCADAAQHGGVCEFVSQPPADAVPDADADADDLAASTVVRARYLWWSYLQYTEDMFPATVYADIWDDCSHYAQSDLSRCLRERLFAPVAGSAGNVTTGTDIDAAAPAPAPPPDGRDALIIMGGQVYVGMARNGQMSDAQHALLPDHLRRFIAVIRELWPPQRGPVVWFEPTAWADAEDERARISALLLPVVERETKWLVLHSTPQYTAQRYRNALTFEDVVHHPGLLTATHVQLLLNVLRANRPEPNASSASANATPDTSTH